MSKLSNFLFRGGMNKSTYGVYKRSRWSGRKWNKFVSRKRRQHNYNWK